MTDEITPARLRELAERQQAFADRMDTWASDSDMADETAAALRAAARSEEDWRVAFRGMHDENEELRATLAAREALLRRADVFLGLAWRYADGGWYEGQSQDKQNIEALAAEIAAALKETDQ